MASLVQCVSRVVRDALRARLHAIPRQAIHGRKQMLREAARDGAANARLLTKQRLYLRDVETGKDFVLHRLGTLVVSFTGEHKAFSEALARLADAVIRLATFRAAKKANVAAQHAVEVTRLLVLVEETILRLIAHRYRAGQQSVPLLPIKAGRDQRTTKHRLLRAAATGAAPT